MRATLRMQSPTLTEARRLLRGLAASNENSGVSLENATDSPPPYQESVECNREDGRMEIDVFDATIEGEKVDVLVDPTLNTNLVGAHVAERLRRTCQSIAPMRDTIKIRGTAYTLDEGFSDLALKIGSVTCPTDVAVLTQSRHKYCVILGSPWIDTYGAKIQYTRHLSYDILSINCDSVTGSVKLSRSGYRPHETPILRAWVGKVVAADIWSDVETALHNLRTRFFWAAVQHHDALMRQHDAPANFLKMQILYATAPPFKPWKVKLCNGNLYLREGEISIRIGNKLLRARFKTNRQYNVIRSGILADMGLIPQRTTTADGLLVEYIPHLAVRLERNSSLPVLPTLFLVEEDTEAEDYDMELGTPWVKSSEQYHRCWPDQERGDDSEWMSIERYYAHQQRTLRKKQEESMPDNTLQQENFQEPEVSARVLLLSPAGQSPELDAQYIGTINQDSMDWYRIPLGRLDLAIRSGEHMIIVGGHIVLALFNPNEAYSYVRPLGIPWTGREIRKPKISIISHPYMTNITVLLAGYSYYTRATMNLFVDPERFSDNQYTFCLGMDWIREIQKQNYELVTHLKPNRKIDVKPIHLMRPETTKQTGEEPANLEDKEPIMAETSTETIDLHSSADDEVSNGSPVNTEYSGSETPVIPSALAHAL